MKIFTIVGARPNFIKIDPELKQTIVHSGQHYDARMSQVFFDELNLPKPKYNLNCRGNQVGKMIDKLGRLFKKEQPSMVIVFGDTHSSLAGALAAAYQNIPIVHIEAGLRSFNSSMPEEINRKLIDQMAKVKICPNNYSRNNLLAEGIKDNVYVVGDPLFDALCKFIPFRKTKNYQKYILITIHRNFNVDNKDNLKIILEALEESGESFVFPIHPRTEKNLKEFKLKIPKNVKVVKPTTYKQTLALISNAKKVITDSGGVQREAAWMNVPVILLRTETEWIELPTNGKAVLVGTDKERLKEAIRDFRGRASAPPEAGVNARIRAILYKYV